MTKEGKKTFNVFVSVLPQKFLVEAVCGEYVKVNVILKPGQDPNKYRPDSKQILGLKACDYYVRIGLPFEYELTERALVINPDLKFIDSIKGIDRMQIMADGKKKIDPYIWLSLELDRQIIRNIYEFFREYS